MNLLSDRRFPASWLFVACICLSAAETRTARTASDPQPIEKLAAVLPQAPEELKAESAIFLQRRLSRWTLEEARRLLGEPRRRRDAHEDAIVTGDIYAFPDPTSRYREFELQFDRESGKLRSVFVYPWSMTWDDCRELWGGQVSTTRNADGTVFHSYLDRHLDVLLDARGRVINLGVYPAR